MKIKTIGHIVYRLGEPALVASVPSEDVDRLRGQNLEVTIREAKRIRSLPQNAKLHAIAQEIAEDTGHDLDEVKTYCKRRAVKRGYPVRVDANGEPLRSLLDGDIVPESSAKVTKEQAAMLIEELTQLAAELGIRLGDE